MPKVDEVKAPKLAEQNLRARLEGRTENAFAEAERQGLMLAAKVRTAALLLIIFWVVVSNSEDGFELVYSIAEIVPFWLIGILQYICAKYRFHIQFLKYVFVLADCAVLAFVLVTPEPFDMSPLPPAVAMDGSRAAYFYIFLLLAAFSLRPQLVLWCGLCIVAARTAVLLWFTSQPGVYTDLELSEPTIDTLLGSRANPNFVFLGFWPNDILVTLILAAGLAVVVQRSRRLVDSRAIAERMRASLARYFSPNVVDHISASDQILGDVREQDVAVLFADIMGFTKLCESESPDNVIAILREYHNRFGKAVFDNHGTLDKYIGDGLMATFGIPEPGQHDASNALQCAMDMIAALAEWNAERASKGEDSVRVGVGLHYGSVIAGDIGNERRLEYGVIGDTVNIASRLEQLTRRLNTPLVVSDSLISSIARNGDDSASLLTNLTDGGVQKIRGRDSGVAVWIFKSAEPK